nr:zinc finger FYVE domain-containing protein 26 isoform X1 [Paramormyrops kingsleyae]
MCSREQAPKEDRKMHPFSCEEDSSMEQLFSFFTLCLQCGDWELAQACVPQLNNTTCTSTQCLQDILKSLVTCPYVLKWETVGSPHRLAWLWLKISERWAHEQVAVRVKNELEFLLIVEELENMVPEEVLKELHQAFRSVQIEKKGTMVILSAEAECCLGTLLDRSRPRLAQALVHFLQGHRADDDACDRKHLLQEAFIQFLLAKVQQSGQAEVGWEEKLYSALAVMPWGPEPVEGQLHDLCRALWAASTGPLSEERVLSSLLRPRCHAALSFYCSMAVQLQRDELLKDVAASQVDLTEAGKLMLGLCCHAERASAWKAIYFECLSSNKHFLDQVLITALDLIRREEFSRLKDLTAAEFHPLSRLLLLLGWTHLQSLGSAQKLLETLHHSQALANDSVLKDFVDGLSSQLGVLEWCAKNSPGTPSAALLAQLHTLDSHSSLFILQSLTPLPQLDERKVLELFGLAHSPSSGDTDTAHPVDTPNLSARRNVVLFQGFCAMKYALYAICVNAHKYSGCRDCLVAKEPQELESKIEQDQTSTLSQGFSVLFQYYLSECQLYLEAVPALFRLELLENIFSLLFLSSADFVLSRERDIEHGLPHEQYLPSRCGLEKSDNPEFRKESKGGGVVVDWTLQQPQQPGRHTLQNLVCNYVDLGHFIQDCKGFLVDTVAMEGFLRLLRESLEGVCVVGQRDGLEEGRALAGEEEMAESLGCSVTPETFGTRLQRLSKRIAEAHWRLQVITSNHGSSSNGQIPTTKLVSRVPSLKHNGGMKRRKKSRRHRTERHSTAEQHNGEVSTSTSDGSVGVAGAPAEQEPCPCGGPHSWLIPAMLSSPESLLISCIRRGNFLEAHQVSLMFGLDGSACSGELVFMEHHRDVLVELGCVEQKIENQVADGSASGRSRLGSSGRSTLQAIGSAAAAGMAFYSISDMADMLLSTPGRPVPSLEEDYWLNHKVPDPSGVLHALLEEFSPASMATFDLACCHCLLWKTSRQLLETAERRLNTTLEGRGVRTDSTVPHSHGIKGFPAVLQQISKIINHSVSGKGSPRAELPSEESAAASPFGCSAREVLLCLHPVLTEEDISARLSLAQHLEQTLCTLASATDSAADGRVGGGLLAALVEQASFKQSELDSHPVRSQMKQLLRTLDQLCPSEPDSAPFRPDYVRSFLDYVNTLAVVLVRSLSSEDQTSEVKLGNPLLVLLQLPSQLVSHLLFDRQVSPIRVSSLLEQEGLGLNIQQVIVQRCCETLPVWETCCESMGETGRKTGGLLSLNSVKVFLQKYSQEHPLTVCPSSCDAPPSSDSDASPEEAASLSSGANSSQSSPASSSSSSSLLLTPSSLSFLKSHSPILAVLACLSACRGGAGRTGSAWPGLPAYFRSGRKEGVLDIEQVAREAEALLKDLPILHAYLQTMAQPVLGPVGSPEGSGAVSGLSASLCGLPLAGLLLSGLHRASACSAAAGAFQQALTDRDVERALNLLELYGQDSHQEQKLRDSLLACSALREGNRTMEHLFRVEDAELRARVALQGLEQWPLASCLELLRFCLSDGNTECSLKEELELKKQELQIYQRMLNLQPPLPWATWQELKVQSGCNTEAVFCMMLEANEFQLCGQWVQLYPVSMQLRLQLQTEHLLHLLERGQMEEAFQLLESLTDSALCLEVCEHALDRRPGLAACHFLADYLTLHFQDGMSPARRHLIHALHLGSKVLLTLPPDAQEDYFPLLSNPLLMLEQLLMNLKVDWAAVAVRTLRGLLLGQECIISPGDIDALLSSYARKALEFPYAPRERTRSDSVISLQDVLTQCPAQESSSSSASLETSPSTSGSTPVHTPCAGGGRRTKPTAYFTPPEKPPSRKDWIPDHQQSVCMVCLRERFTMFNRRHHCRRCGRLVCQACSGHRMPLEGFAEDTSRVCNQCYGFFHPVTDEEMEPAEVAGSPVTNEECFYGVLTLPEVSRRQYRLSMDPAENLQLQSEFYYEQGPSSSLCIAILSLHSDHVACGHQLIDHCHSLSRGLTNPEVDARLLTDIMRQLLFSAKLMFVKAGQNQDLALCDSYISKVDVLKILVVANYKYVPSLDDISESAAITRLRNQLLEAEYYQLAVEVSTKSALDPGGVWHAWGIASLKAGSLTIAREKFARCLKAPVDRNQLNHGPRLLREIIQHLESTVWSSHTQHAEQDILASLRELEETLADPGSQDNSNGQGQQNCYYEECLYYLHHYGTHLAIVSFYMRHDDMKGALLHLRSKECPEEVFLEGVLQPSLEQGRLGALQGLLEGLDPSLENWSRYLIASCQFLQRRGHFHTLYQLQQFMMDHVRAAMTCIRFFAHGAKSYLQLGEQQRWLVRAKEHLRTYLQEQQGRCSSRRKSSSTFRKKMSSSDVSRHMNTIELQLEVTRFLHRCESSAGPGHAPQAQPPASNAPPPTLFEGSSMKVDVACKVMLGGKNIEEGFGIAYRVIQDFQLESPAVYVRTGQWLVRQRQYGAVRQLLKCVGESGAATKNDCDRIVLSCVSAADKGPADAKELESLILESKSVENKINGYLLCSKLRAAYLLAVKLEPGRAGPLVAEVMQAAEKTGDSIMQDICRQWLAEHQDRPPRQQVRSNAR